MLVAGYVINKTPLNKMKVDRLYWTLARARKPAQFFLPFFLSSVYGIGDRMNMEQFVE
jgi:hypothetical protein